MAMRNPAETARPGAPPEPERDETDAESVRQRNLRDIGMLVLAVVSIGIVAYDFFYRSTLDRGTVFLLEMVDLVIVGIFAVEFVWRMSQEERKGRFALRNWFDIVGLVPMIVTSFPLFRAFRLFRVFMIASRLMRMWSYFTGEKSAQLVFDRYRAALIEEVTDRVLLRMVGMTEDIVARGGYTRALGDSLEERREDIGNMAVESSKANDLARWFRLVPGFEGMVRTVAHSTVDTAVAALRSEEMQRTFQTTIANVIAEARVEIERKNWKEMRPEGGGVLRRGAPRGAGAGPSASPVEDL